MSGLPPAAPQMPDWWGVDDGREHQVPVAAAQPPAEEPVPAEEDALPRFASEQEAPPSLSARARSTIKQQQQRSPSQVVRDVDTQKLLQQYRARLQAMAADIEEEMESEEEEDRCTLILLGIGIIAVNR